MFTGKKCVLAVLIMIGVSGWALGQISLEAIAVDTSRAEVWIETTDSGCLGAEGGEDARENGPSEPTVGPCTERDVIEYRPGNSGVRIVHWNATYNCCPDDIVTHIMVDHDRITIIEKEILTHPCTCNCCYNVYSTIYALPAGEYHVKYCWYDYEEGEEVCDYQVIRVPEPYWIEYGHNDCMDPTSLSAQQLVGPCRERDLITYEADERMLRIFHDNATYNCCLDDIVIEMDVEDHTLLFREKEILTDPCRCVCCYDIWARVFGLPSGEYRTKYCWYDYEVHEEVCDAQVIRIP